MEVGSASFRPLCICRRRLLNGAWHRPRFCGRGRRLDREDAVSQPGLSLTDNEGPLLVLVLRVQPVTAYQIAKIYADSPVTDFNASKGKLYPLIQRLVGRGLLKG